MKIGIMGYGEIGKSLERVYHDFPNYETKIKDINRDEGFEGIGVLNVCIPNLDNFTDLVAKEINTYKPRLTIIHSTVSPGTTKKIRELIPAELHLVHSPVRGTHPNLYEGLKTFVKFIGGEGGNSSEEARKHLESLGIKARILQNSLATEVGKLLDTTYYGVAIAWHGEMKKLCEKYSINFDDAVTEFNKTYNEGYKELGKGNVIRPVLSPPENDKIGGHCVIPNAKILKQIWNSPFLDALLRYGG